MPNALILEYQKSRIGHTPSHLRPPERATKKDTQVTTLTRISSLTHDNAAIATQFSVTHKTPHGRTYSYH
jgi:hypothetical protein